MRCSLTKYAVGPGSSSALRDADLVDGQKVDTGPFNKFLGLMEGCRPDFPAFEG